MRFEQLIRGNLRQATLAAVTLCLFASGRPVSAFEQNPAPPAAEPPAAPSTQAPAVPSTQAPAAPPVRPAAPAGQPAAPAGQTIVLGSQTIAPGETQFQVTSDEAVRMALENNLGIRAERLSPQVQALILNQTRANYAPMLISTLAKNSSTTPPEDFLTGSGSALTNTGVRTNGGLQQLLKWGGGSYQVTLDGARNTTSNAGSAFNPRLSSNLNAVYTQPLLRNFSIDTLRHQLLTGQKQQEIVDLQLQQRLTQTARSVRSAYYDLLGAIGQLQVAQQSLDLANESLRNNRRRVEVGTIPPIDIVEAQAEVSRNEEAVIVNEAQVRALEDALRTLVLNPSQPDFWTTRIVPSEQPVLTPHPVDVETAIRNALDNRTDLAQLRRQMDQTDISIKYAHNQKLPAVDLTTSYNVVGLAGTQNQFDYGAGVIPAPIIGTNQRSFGTALRDVLGNDFKTWAVQVNVSYPIGTSTAEVALAQGRLQHEQQVTNLRDQEVQVTAQVRDAARQVDTSLKRVDATRNAREFAERRYEAEQKRMNVGLSTTFQLFQAQRDLATARLSELNAVIAYNRSLVNFEAVQLSPLGGR
jgi:outer membrane protein